MNPETSKRWIIVLLFIAAIGIGAAAVYSQSSRVLGLVLNSVQVAGMTSLIAIPLGSFLGLAIFRTRIPGQRFFLFAFVAALLIPLYIQAASWDAGFGRLGWFPMVGGENPGPLLDDWVAVIWIHAMAATPWVVLIVGLGSTTVDPELEEMALLDLSVFRTFCSVTLKRCLPAILASAIWILLTTFGEMTVTDIYGVRTYAEEVYLNYALNELGMIPFSAGWTVAESASINMLLQLMVSAGLAGLGAVFVLSIAPISKFRGRSRLKFDLGKFHYPVFLGVAISALLVLGVPIGNLIFKTGHQLIPTESSAVSTWSLNVFFGNLSDVPRLYGENFQWTFLIGLTAATITMLLAVPIAWRIRRLRWLGIVMIGLLIVALSTPAPTIGILVISIFNQPAIPGFVYLYDRTIFPLAIACVFRALPLATLFCWHAMRQVSGEVLNQAEVDGANRFQRFINFGILSHKVPLAAAFLLAFVISISELAAIILVSPPRIDPVQRLVFGYIHAGVDDQVAVLCLTQVLMIVPLTVIAALMFREKKS